MYVPKHFAHDERAHLLAVMHEHSFATVVSNVDDELFATHVPLRVDDVDGTLRIEGHVAAVNAHARAFDAGARALVIYRGPHTYISPTLYRSAGRVPTWNYIAVHASGTTRAVHDAAAKQEILLRLIDEYEPTFRETFARFEDRQRDALIRAITGFEITVDHVEGKFKLGQHRLQDDLPEMQSSHEQGDPDRREIAAWMKRLGYWT
jgi:transcriptional regulator